jgi:hypothetical protein
MVAVEMLCHHCFDELFHAFILILGKGNNLLYIQKTSLDLIYEL